MHWRCALRFIGRCLSEKGIQFSITPNTLFTTQTESNTHTHYNRRTHIHTRGAKQLRACNTPTFHTMWAIECARGWTRRFICTFWLCVVYIYIYICVTTQRIYKGRTLVGLLLLVAQRQRVCHVWRMARVNMCVCSGDTETTTIREGDDWNECQLEANCVWTFARSTPQSQQKPPYMHTPSETKGLCDEHGDAKRWTRTWKWSAVKWNHSVTLSFWSGIYEAAPEKETKIQAAVWADTRATRMCTEKATLNG